MTAKKIIFHFTIIKGSLHEYPDVEGKFIYTKKYSNSEESLTVCAGTKLPDISDKCEDKKRTEFIMSVGIAILKVKIENMA